MAKLQKIDLSAHLDRVDNNRSIDALNKKLILDGCEKGFHSQSQIWWNSVHGAG